MQATSLFPTLLSSLASAERNPACVGECLCVWVGVLVLVCACVCVCVGGGGGGGRWERNSGRGRDVHTAAVTQRERRERREGGDL